MRNRFPPVSINISSVQIVGWPGLAVVLIAVAIAMEFPESRWLLLAGLAGGALMAGVLIAARRSL